MRVSLNWVKEFVDIAIPPAELGKVLTMAGLEVEALEPLGHSLGDIVAGRILSVKRHPRADRLSLCLVDTGSGEVPVVCGAPNVMEGMIAPVALPGTKLPGGLTIQETKIRGERSVGMLLAEDEMGLTDDHSGIMNLPAGVQVGSPVSSALSLEDWALEIALTPNRPDCASVLGIAREVAALTGQKLRRPLLDYQEGEVPAGDLARVDIEDPEGCPRYAAGVIQGVVLKSSPFWLRYRLHACGLRAINNVVDVTNYVLLELGQPLHSFDYDRLAENRIVVRKAKEGETFTTLDGKTHSLNDETLMICDGRRPVAIAGIMGGLNSEIFSGSRNVLLESAYFDPATIRRASKSLEIATEASYRFERGVDVEGVVPALKRALMLISELAGGRAARGIIDCYPRPHSAPEIELRTEKTNHFLGMNLSAAQIMKDLKALEMDVQERGEGKIKVKPPTFRVDISREVDLMEEVARLEGYDQIPVTFPPVKPMEESDTREFTVGAKVKEVMVGLGFDEIITYSFISPQSIDLLGADRKSPLRAFVRIVNPLTVDQSVMRTSLIPGLLSTVKINIFHGEEDLRLFEWGKVFIARKDKKLPLERVTLAAVMTGFAEERAWYRRARKVDFYDIKGATEGLLRGLGLGEQIRFQKAEPAPGYESNVYSEIYFAESPIGHLGRLTRRVLAGFELDTEEVYVFEMDLDFLCKREQATRTFRPLSRFPAVFRDISVLVHKEIESAKIIHLIREVGGELIEDVNLYDLYEGRKIDPSEKAFSFRICYRSKDRTLDGKEVNQLTETVIEKIRKETGARLREG